MLVNICLGFKANVVSIVVCHRSKVVIAID